MGKENKRRRYFVIKKKRERYEKIKKLKERYLAGDSIEKQKIIEKIMKLSPGYPMSELTKSK
jgi:hypothetical protein